MSFIVFNFLWCRFESMDIYQLDLNTMLVAVYFNGTKPNLFRVLVDVTLVYLKDQPDQINQRLNHIYKSRVDEVRYRRPSIDSVERLQVIQMMPTNNYDLRSMFSIFGEHIIFSTTELDFSLRDLLKIFSRVWFGHMNIRLYYYVVSLFCWN